MGAPMPPRDIHAGAVTPTRNALQVGGLVGVGGLAASGGDVGTAMGLGLLGALLAAIGSSARAELRKIEERDDEPSFWRGFLLRIGSALG
jgi:hypothetical protein